MQENPVENTHSEPAPMTTNREHYVGTPVVTPKVGSFEKIRHVTAWVMIISAVLFALIGILGIWSVFGDNAGNVIWRAFSSLGIIAFAALIVNVAARTAESRQ